MEVKKTSAAKVAVIFLLLATIYFLYTDVAVGFINDPLAVLTMGPFVFFQAVNFFQMGLFIALLIILFTPDKHLLNCFELLSKSFRRYKELAFILFVDLIFFLLLYFFVSRALDFFKETTFKHLGSEQAVLNDPSIIVSYFQSISFLVLGLSLILFVVYTLSRSIIWRVLVGKSFSLKYFANFFKINFVWCLLWLIPSVIIFLGLTPQFKFIGMIYSLIVFSYFTGVLHYSVANEKTVLKTFGLLSLGSFTHLLTPYSIIYTGYAVLANLSRLFPYQEYTSYVLFFLAMACLRVYLVEIFINFGGKK